MKKKLSFWILALVVIVLAFFLSPKSAKAGTCDVYLTQADFDPYLDTYTQLSITNPGIYCLQEDIRIEYRDTIANHLPSFLGFSPTIAAINVETSDVQILFEGHTIENTHRYEYPQDNVIGINIGDVGLYYNNTTMMGGTMVGFTSASISGFYDPSLGSGSGDLLVKNMEFVENHYGVAVNYGSNLTVEENNFIDNTFAISFYEVSNSTVNFNNIESDVNNFISWCCGRGDITLYNGENNLIVGNTLANNDFYYQTIFHDGINIEGQRNFTITNNTIDGYYAGIRANYSSDGVITKNIIIGSDSPFASLPAPRSDGIVLMAPNGLVVSKNDITKTYYGVRVGDVWDYLQKTKVADNRVCHSVSPLFISLFPWQPINTVSVSATNNWNWQC